MNAFNFFLDFLQQNQYVAYVVWTIIVLSLGFLVFFIIPYIRLHFSLRKTVKKLKSVEASQSDELLSNLTDCFEKDNLKQIWKEYAKTLHQKNTGGQHSRLRSTTLAENFFTEQAIVDTPLKIDFFKHLPGILTGLGIIGTFIGLIAGLHDFDPVSPEKAKESLKPLIAAVEHAFTVSAGAIIAAIFVTFFEKITIASLYSKVAQINDTIDGFFNMGVTEEYLETIANQAEESANQAKHIKNALVSELGQLMERISENQINALQGSSTQMAGNVSQAITGTFQKPLNAIEESLTNLRGKGTDAVNDLLTSAIAQLSEEIKEVFGTKMTKVAEQIEGAGKQMEKAASELQKVASQIGNKSEENVNKLSVAIESHLKKIGDVATKQNEDFKSNITKSIQALESQIGTVTQNLTEKQGDITDHATKQMDDIDTKAKDISDNMNELIKSIKQLTSSTTDNIEKIDAGAEKLNQAATEFAQAGDSVSSTLNQSQEVAQSLTKASSTLATYSENSKNAIQQFADLQESLKNTAESLQQTSKSLSDGTSVSSEMVQNIKNAADSLQLAGMNATEYLDQINNVLETTHSSFATQLQNTLGTGNQELSNAVGLVSSAVQELGNTIDDITTTNQRHNR